MTKNKLQRIAKNKLQIGKFVKNHSSNSNKSLTFLLVCRNLPGKANLKIVKRFLLFLWVFQIFLNYNNCHKYNQPIYGIAKCVLYLFQIFVQLNVMLKKMRHIYFAREKVEFRDWSLEALADYLIQHEILWGSKSTKKLSDPSFRREKTERGG